MKPKWPLKILLDAPRSSCCLWQLQLIPTEYNPKRKVYLHDEMAFDSKPVGRIVRAWIESQSFPGGRPRTDTLPKGDWRVVREGDDDFVGIEFDCGRMQCRHIEEKTRVHTAPDGTRSEFCFSVAHSGTQTKDET